MEYKKTERISAGSYDLNKYEKYKSKKLHEPYILRVN
jgi:hypothetical protein